MCPCPSQVSNETITDTCTNSISSNLAVPRVESQLVQVPPLQWYGCGLYTVAVAEELVCDGRACTTSLRTACCTVCAA